MMWPFLVLAWLVTACSTTGSVPADCAPDAAQPYCLWGGPCSCNDVGNAPPICVGTSWECPDGSTPFEQCQGVPPKPDCGVPSGAGAD